MVDKKKPVKKPTKPAVTKQQQAHADEIAAMVLLVECSKKEQKAREVKSQQDALVGTLNEFLNSYILMGYDMDGNPVALRYTKTHQESDALSTLLMKYIQHQPTETDD